MDNLEKIEKKIDKILEAMTEIRVESEARLSKLETSQKGFIGVFSAIITAVLSALISLFNK